MAKLTRKLWVGIGAATIAGASMASTVSAQHGSHKQEAAPQPPAQDGPAMKTPAEGGEAYLTDGGPKDTRIRFYRDIALMRGHLRVVPFLVSRPSRRRTESSEGCRLRGRRRCAE